jgi:two-component system sensor histidine kinase PilS (NtrC family)
MDATLEQRLKTLMAFRLVMVTTLLLVAVYMEAESDYLLPFNPFYGVIVFTYAATVVHASALRLVRRGQLLVYAQVIGDLLTITGLVYVTGLGRGGFTLLYPISVLVGSVLLFRGGGHVLGMLATLFFGALLAAVRLKLIAPQGLSEVVTLPANAVLYSIFVTGVVCATVALIGSYLAASLHHAGERLEEATGQVADLQQLNEAIVNSIHSGLITTDVGGRVRYANALSETILGRPRAALLGRTPGEVFGSPVLGSPAPGRGPEFSSLDLSYARPDGQLLELGVSVSPLAAGEGGQLLAFQDLTEMRHLEREVRAKEKLAAVGEMAAQLAHEIRNPLGAISGSAQVLLADVDLSTEQAHLLEIIRRESRRLSDSLNSFLHQTRATPAPTAPVDLRPVIEEAVTLLRNAADVSPAHVVEFEADAGPHRCLADRDKIAQVFWNLARNGLEAMPEGGRLQIRLARRKDEVVLSVRDEGRGRTREDQPRLFEPFRSVGTGLGLAIVYRIVREHRGDITVRSAPPRGTEFEVHLPLAAAPVLA